MGGARSTLAKMRTKFERFGSAATIMSEDGRRAIRWILWKQSMISCEIYSLELWKNLSTFS
jgi:hypothetical protein